MTTPRSNVTHDWGVNVSSTAMLDRIDSLADEFWANNPNLQTRNAHPTDIEECYQQLASDRWAQVYDEIDTYLATERVTPSASAKQTHHATKAERRQSSRLRDKAVAWIKVVAKGEQLKDCSNNPIPLRLTLEERRDLLLAGKIPVCADLRKYQRDEIKQLKAIRRGLFITCTGKKVPLAKRKLFGLTATGRQVAQQIAA